MSKENNRRHDSDVLAKLHEARALVDECIAKLSGNRSSRKHKKESVGSVGQKVSSHTSRRFDFDANERAFMREHAKDLGNGKKFALVLSYLAKVDLAMPVINGLDAAPVLKKILPDARLILFTAHDGRQVDLLAQHGGFPR